MATFKRKKYFINPAVQLRYIFMSVVPALFMSLFCTYILLENGESLLALQSERLQAELTFFNDVFSELAQSEYPPEVIRSAVNLNKRLFSMQSMLHSSYQDTREKLDQTRFIIFLILPLVLLGVALLSLLYSHRIAGPIYRIKKCVTQLSHGEDIPPVKLRKYDEFKELADSLDSLRDRLREKGFLQPTPPPA